MKKLYLQALTISFLIISCSGPIFSQHRADSNFIYASCLRFLANGNYAFYKYGNVKPRNLEDAFCVFLTGDSSKLQKFRTLTIDPATSYALNKEYGLMRYDWGCEAFRELSKLLIFKYKIYVPELQHELAVRSFHHWINNKEPNFKEITKRLRKENRDLNKRWKNRYFEFILYANNKHLKGKVKRDYKRLLRKSRACSL